MVLGGAEQEQRCSGSPAGCPPCPRPPRTLLILCGNAKQARGKDKSRPFNNYGTSALSPTRKEGRGLLSGVVLVIDATRTFYFAQARAVFSGPNPPPLTVVSGQHGWRLVVGVVQQIAANVTVSGCSSLLNEH